LLQSGIVYCANYQQLSRLLGVMLHFQNRKARILHERFRKPKRSIIFH
jgi:hypothetical protein